MDPLAQRVAAKFVAKLPVAHETITHGEVSKLPVGSIVLQASDTYGSNAFIVLPSETLAPITLLPERAGGHQPEGESMSGFGKEFILVSKGKGKLPTHATAVHAVEQWQRAQKKTSSETDQDAILDILDEIDSKVDPDLLETLGKGLTMHVEKLPNHGGHASTYAHDVVQIAKNLKTVLKELRQTLGG